MKTLMSTLHSLIDYDEVTFFAAANEVYLRLKQRKRWRKATSLLH